MYQHPEPTEIVANTLFPASASLHVDVVAEATTGGLAQLVEQIQDRERGGVLQDPKAIAVPLPVGNNNDSSAMQLLIQHLEDQKEEVKLAAKTASEHSTGFSSRSKGYKEPQDQTLTESEEEDAVYVPFEY